MISVLVIAGMLAVGFFNGANDVSKSIATLVGSGVTRYRTAIVWGSMWTFAGGAFSVLAARGLTTAFSGQGFFNATLESPAFILSVAVGALAWIWLATATGMPVSTTHALTGGLVGAAMLAVGSGGIQWTTIAAKFALPLAASPLLSGTLVFLVFPLVRAGLGPWQNNCICVQKPIELAHATPDFAVLAAPSSSPRVVADEMATCASAAVTISGITFVDALHWLSSGATAFARGLNDTPKILGLGIVAAAALNLPETFAFLLVTTAMSAGSLVRGFKVTETLAQKVTPMAPLEGLAANLLTSLLVVFASKFALPVSTTHVSAAAIVGLGLRRNVHDVRWKTVGGMLIAWVVTLPTSALLAALAYSVFRHVT